MFVFLLSLIVLSNVVSGNAADIEDYYWREFHGTIPSDALPGGVDKAGNPTYIGEMYMKDYGLLLATIVNGSNIALAESHGKTFKTEKNVKILCSVEQDKFNWIDANVGEEDLFRDSCPLVDGGSASNQIIHIGRTVHNGETIVGRVFSYWKKYQGLHIPYNGGSVHVKSYQILTFDCKNYCPAN